MAASAAAIAKSGSSRTVRSRSKRRHSSPPRDWSKLPKIILLGLAALMLGAIVVRTSAVDALIRKRPHAAAWVAPSDPRVIFARGRAEFSQRQGNLSPARTNATIAALRKDPLAADPFFFGGLRALVRNDSANAEKMLVEARRRNPRARTARLLLLDRYLRTGRVEAAANEIVILSRLIPAANKVLIPEVAKFAKDPKTRPALERVLRADPDMRQAVLAELAGSDASPELVLQLAGAQARSTNARSARWQAALLDRMVKRGEIRRARTLWSSFVGGGAAQSDTVYDPLFKRLPGPPPFTWDFAASNAGVAEPSKTQGLEIAYYGRLPAVLARQLLVLSPGRYALSFRAAGDMVDNGESLAWIVTCVPSNATAAAMPVGKISYNGTRVARAFVVPATGCEGQWLTLAGKPSEFPTAVNVTMTQLKLSKVATP